MNQKDQTRKLPGFYIALCCCVIAIGAAGFVAQHMESKSTNAITEVKEPDLVSETTSEPAEPDSYEGQAAMSQDTIVIDEPVSEQIGGEVQQPPAEETAVEDYAIDNPDIEAASVVVNAQESEMFVSPVPNGSILAGFSGDTLEYNEVFEDWRTHNGVDIEAAEGCSVSAAAKGVVCDITESSFGRQVTIQHDNGYSTVYAQLNDINVSEGDEVESGAVIGTVGSSRGENVNTSHLHFEIRRDGTPLNPEEY